MPMGCAKSVHAARLCSWMSPPRRLRRALLGAGEQPSRRWRAVASGGLRLSAFRRQRLPTPTTREIDRRDLLGGLIYEYHRAAARDTTRTLAPSGPSGPPLTLSGPVRRLRGVNRATRVDHRGVRVVL